MSGTDQQRERERKVSTPINRERETHRSDYTYIYWANYDYDTRVVRPTERRNDVYYSMRESFFPIRKNCFGKSALDRGHRRVPLPPAKIRPFRLLPATCMYHFHYSVCLPALFFDMLSSFLNELLPSLLIIE